MKKTPLARRLATLAAAALLWLALAEPPGRAATQAPAQDPGGATTTKPEPPATSRPDRIYKDFMSEKITSSDAKDQLQALIKGSPSLPEKIESAARFAHVCGMIPSRENPIDASSAPQQRTALFARRSAENRLAVETAMPLLQSLDETHLNSLPALDLALDLCGKVKNMGQPSDADASITIDENAVLGRIMNADPAKLVPPDKEYAKDEDPTAERTWASRQLELLQTQAALPYFMRLRTAFDTSASSQTARIQSLMARHPANRVIQQNGQRAIDAIMRLVRGDAR